MLWSLKKDDDESNKRMWFIMNNSLPKSTMPIVQNKPVGLK
jgi:hypothetical protein